MVDYILTVAVSVSAGVRGHYLDPTAQGLAKHRVAVCLGIILLITLANLRWGQGVRSALRVPHVRLHLHSRRASFFLGLTRTEFHWFGGIHTIKFNPAKAKHGLRQFGGSLSLFILLRGFSSGRGRAHRRGSDLQRGSRLPAPGVEERGNTLTWMATILVRFSSAVSILAHHLHP